MFTIAAPPRADLAFPGPPCALDCVLRAEADHRVANHLMLLSAFVRLQARQFEGPGPRPDRADVQVLMQSLDGQIRAVARLHRLMMTGDQSTPVDLAVLLHEVCAPFGNGLEGRFAIIEHLAPGCYVTPDQVMPISQIVSEAVTNAMKHARPDGGFGVISVGCHLRPYGEVVIEISDDGVGLAEDFDPACSGGFGLHLIRGLAAGLHAGLAFTALEPGLCVRLSLPAP